MINTNYDVGPDALKTIESKIRQMQATGANITPEMMEAIYSSVLEAGADRALEKGKIETEAKIRGKELETANARFNEEMDLRKDALDTRKSEGLGGAIGSTLLYGGRYAAKKGWLDGLNPFGKTATPGGTTTPEGIKTIGGQSLTPEIGTKSTFLPGAENPLAGMGDISSLELSPSALPGPVTTPPAATEALGGIPTEFLGEAGQAPVSVAETAPELVETMGEIGADTLADTGVETLAQTGSGTGFGSFAGPAGAGAFGAGLLKMAGVRDDVGKVLLFGEGGENEQDIAGGVAGGAGAGAAAGTYIFPGVGTAIGGILGGIVGGLSSAFDDLF